jgi:tight adherence protein B
VTALWTALLVLSVGSAVRLRPDPDLREVPAATPRHRPTRRRRVGEHRRVLAAWCDSLGAEMRSGATLHRAVATVPGPDTEVWREVRRRVDRGIGLTEAVDVTGSDPDDQAVLTVLAACGQHGGGSAAPLDQVAATLRRRSADAAERRVQSAQARMSARVMTTVPIAMLVVLVATSPAVRRAIVTPGGAGVVTVGTALNLVGWSWMRRLIGTLR